ncbi:DUF6538 domain-containing protein [Roseateles terrae]|uniref:DUF6538 domain-containing protein n=1 Tax=Roseateles terrae TaxID=431060 RepID=UPI0035BF9825
MRRSGVRSSSSPPPIPKGLQRKAATLCFFWDSSPDKDSGSGTDEAGRVTSPCDKHCYDPFPGVTRRSDSSVYWFCLRAPKDLREHFSRPWAIRISLQTTDLREANEKARKFQAEWAEKFARLRKASRPQPVALSPAIAAELRRWVLQADDNARDFPEAARACCCAKPVRPSRRPRLSWRSCYPPSPSSSPCRSTKQGLQRVRPLRQWVTPAWGPERGRGGSPGELECGSHCR